MIENQNPLKLFQVEQTGNPRLKFLKLVAWVIGILISCSILHNIKASASFQTDSASPATAVHRTEPRDPRACEVASLKKSSQQGLKVYNYTGDRYLMNSKDNNKIDQVYVGATGSDRLICITCSQQPGGPRPNRMKMQPQWTPSGTWIIVAVERDEYKTPPILGLSRNFVEGQLQNGLWTNMWAVTPDGKNWHRLTDFTDARGAPNGYTGPAITSDGRTFVWSQIVDGNILAYSPFGRWELTQAYFDDTDGAPKLTHVKNITPKGMNWNEPGNFAPGTQTLLLTGSTEKDAQGMDQYTLDIRTGALKNLNNTPTIWDEHGLFSPDGRKIVFMTAYPYHDDPKTSKILTIKTDLMLMDADGTHLEQITHFRAPGYPEYSKGIAAIGVWNPDGRSMSVRQLTFPTYQDWTLSFRGACGNGQTE